jgi:His-Xaa-Ser system protein HxsD
MKKNSNVEIDKKEGRALVSINPKIYSLDVVYSAAYVLLDKAHIILDGDPEEEIIAEIIPKGENTLKELAENFNEELLNYSVYKTQTEKNKGIRQAIMQRALLTGGFDEEEETEDPEGIAVPWEEKYGEDKNK